MTYDFMGFLVVAILISLTPGPAMLFVISQTQRHGAKQGIAAAAGLESGILCYVMVTAFFGSLFLQTFPIVYTIFRDLGALYLLYLAYNTWPTKKYTNPCSEKNQRIDTAKKVFIKGLLINFTNPKIGLFFLSLLPQFIPANTLHPQLTFLVYGLIFNAFGIIVNFSVAIFASRLKQYVTKSAWLAYIPPIIFACISVRLIKEAIWE